MGAGYATTNYKAQNGLWNDRPCEEQRFSMCQRRKEKNLAPMTTTPAPKGCPFVCITPQYSLIHTQHEISKVEKLCHCKFWKT